MDNFNQAPFEGNLVIYIDQKIEMIHKCEIIVLDALKQFLISTNGFEQNLGLDALIHLLIKIRFNVDAGNQLLLNLKEDYRLKQV